MSNSADKFILKGKVTVSYTKAGTREWHARALQFDLVGTGSTKEKALDELRELFTEYVIAVLDTPGHVRFYNPSDQAEWNNPDCEDYTVIISYKRKSKPKVAQPTIIGPITVLRDQEPRIQDIQMERSLVSAC